MNYQPSIYIKSRRAGEPAWHYLSPTGALVWSKLHARRYTSAADAQMDLEVYARMKRDHEFKVVDRDGKPVKARLVGAAQ